MAKVVNQDIPAEMGDAYDQTLHRSAIWIPGSSIRVVRKRVPFELKHMRNISVSTPSKAQRLVRRAFKRSCNCYNIQPYEGGVTPPAIGPRNRSWWHDQAGGSGLWYYDYFIQQTWNDFYANTPPNWCKLLATEDTYVDEYYPNNNFSTLPFVYVNKETNENYIAYFKTTATDPFTISVYAFYTYTYNRTIGVYEVAEEYNTATVTYNTRPALGKLIKSFNSQSDTATWHTVEVSGYKSIALVSLTEHSYPIAFRSIDYADANSRPYFLYF